MIKYRKGVTMGIKDRIEKLEMSMGGDRMEWKTFGIIKGQEIQFPADTNIADLLLMAHGVKEKGPCRVIKHES
jgi:hypothetical protein